MADKRISQLVERVDIANDDVLPIVASGATTTNKVTVSTLQDWMQENVDVGVTSVGITIGSTGTDVNVTGSPVTSSGNITINLPTASATNRGLLSAADWVTFNSKQDAGSFVTLDTAQTITAQKTFTTSGGSDSVIITTTGAGFALDAIKAGNGEVIRVNKTSGTGNAMTVIGGNFEAPTIVKTGGTSSQFLKADGSIDSTAYTTNTGTVTSVSGTGTVSGLSLSGTVTTSGNLTLGGTLSLTSANVTDALGFTPYNATNPAGYTTNVGTVTSVAALTLGTSGTDLSSTVANGTTTPVITLNVPTASAANRGALSAADWTTFNGKQPALNGTGFVKISGTTISYDNSTYLTTGNAASTYLPLVGGTLTGALNVTNANINLSNAFYYAGKLVAGTNIALIGMNASDKVSIDPNGYGVVIGNTLSLGGALNGTSASFTSGITLAGAAGTSIFTSFSVGGTTYGYNGLSGSSGSVITGSVLGDMVIRTVNKSILFSTNDGSTSALTIAASTGEATFSGALNGTSASFTGGVTSGTKFISTAGNNNIIFESLSATTGYQYFQLLNNTAHTIFGIEGTAAGSLLTGGTANASVFTSVGNTNLEFGTNQIKRLTIAASTGAATFSSTVSAGQGTFAVSSGDNLILEKPTGAYLSFKNGSTLRGSINGNNGTDGINLNYGASHTTALAISYTGAATFSGRINSIAAQNQQIINWTGTTGYGYIGLTNTTGYTLFGVEGSVAGSLQTGNSAYSTVLTTVGATDLSLGANQVERLRITSGGYVRLSASSGGIQFNGDTAAANALDDYEEGTWIPDVDAQTGTYTSVFGSRGTYTKIGRVVTVQYYFRVVDKGTGSGRCILSNLPFASLTTSTDDSYTGTGIRQGNDLNTLVINQNSSSLNITENTGDPIVEGQWNAGSITYFT